MDKFFQPEVSLSKESFVYRMKEYLHKHIPTNNYSGESIENYFDVLSMVLLHLFRMAPLSIFRGSARSSTCTV